VNQKVNHQLNAVQEATDIILVDEQANERTWKNVK
jgi:hypothetical protein